MKTEIKPGRSGKSGLLILTITTSLSQFIVYRFIFQVLGKEQMGLWSIVVASTSLGLISNFGLSNGLIKYVAEFKGRKDTTSINRFTGTANAVNILFSLPIIALLYFPSRYFGSSVLNTSQLATFSKVLPWCMFSVFLNNLSSTYICLLDGFQSFFTRCIIQSTGFVVFGVFAVMLASKFGLVGISWALCIQSVFVFLCALIIAYKRNYLEFAFPVYLSMEAFKTLLGYGIKFQLITILVFLFDPIVKYCLTKFFGLNATGIYELANKVLVQFRNIVVNLNQVITPAVASLAISGDADSYMADNFKSNFRNAVNISIAAIICMPLASYFFTGAMNSLYFNAYLLLSVGWLANMVSAPFYYSFLGLGKMIYPIIQHCFYAVVPVVFFALFSKHLPVNLSFLAPATAVFAGGVYLIYIGTVYHRIARPRNIIFKELSLYIFLALLITLMLDQVFFAAKYCLYIIAFLSLVWLVYLYTLDSVRLILYNLFTLKAIKND